MRQLPFSVNYTSSVLNTTFVVPNYDKIISMTKPFILLNKIQIMEGAYTTYIFQDNFVILGEKICKDILIVCNVEINCRQPGYC